MLRADDERVELTARRVERVDGGIDAELRNLAREHQRRVEVGEGRCRRRVREVVGRDVDGLDGGDRAGLRRRDALLQHPHLLRQRRLISHRRRHAPEQRRAFDAGERVAVDVVDEEEHVAPLVAEELGHGEAGQPDAKAIAGRLVHLAVHERHLVENARVGHLVVEVVALAGALPDAREHREAGVLDGDVADELHEAHRLAHARAAEQPDLAALVEGADEVDDLDAGLENLDRRGLIDVPGSLAVDGPVLFGAYLAAAVDRRAQHVHDAPQGLRADGNRDRRSGVVDADASLQPVGRAHRDGAHHAVPDLLLDLEREAVLDLERVVDLGHRVARELHVNDGSDDFDDISRAHE